MRSAASGLSRGAVCAVALMSWVSSLQSAAANDDAAHALADKFSRAAEESQRNEKAKAAKIRAEAQAEAKRQAEAAKKAAADRRAADEAEMLRAAREEAEARRKHDQAREEKLIEAERQAARENAQKLAEEAQKQRAEMERQAEVERSAEAARLQREVEDARIAEEKRLEEERRVAAQKKQEAERQAAREAEARRVAEEKRKAEEARIAEVKRQAEAAEAARKAEEARIAEESRRVEEEARIAEQRRIKEFEDAQQRTALEAEREREAQRIADKFRLAREARERNHQSRSTLGGPMPELEPSPFIDTPATAQATYPQRVTVLIVMRPRRHGFGGHRLTANPVLCVGNYCYVSNGAAAPASVMRRAKALGPGNTLGRNAGACRNQTTCIFRGITLSGPMTTFQPVDMGFLRHDRRETRTIEADRSCDTSGGELACGWAVVSTGYRAWIIPEAIADRAGSLALERALDDGLPAARSASYGGWGSTVHALPTR